MSITSGLLYLEETKDYIRQCIQQKGVSVPSTTTFRAYGDKILEIETAGTQPPPVEAILQEGEAHPTGTQFDLTPDTGYDGFSKVTVDGDVNLKPENIAYGVTIYGVTGTMVAQANMQEVPLPYQLYFDHARTLYTGDYEHLMILESDSAVAFGFMLNGFQVMSYDDNNSEFTAKKWVYVAYNKRTGVWKVEDWTDGTSNGGSFIKNIRYSDAYIYYGNRLLYPFIVNDEEEIIGIPNDVFKFTITITSATKTYSFAAAGQYIIDWGDGSDSQEKSTTNYTTYMPLSHKYSAVGSYTISMIGYVRGLQAGDTNYNVMQFVSEIVTPFPKGCTNVIGTDAGVGLFYKNKDLAGIPGNLFSKASIKNVDYLFATCTGIQSIPPDLFLNVPITSASGVFSECTKLSSIPASLFANGYNLTKLDYAFQGCTKIVSIPTHLFDNCPNLTTVYGCFMEMTILSVIPASLFVNSYDGLDMTNLFGSCSTITGIPSDLFAHISNPIASRMFRYTGITQIPSTLFKNKSIQKLDYAFESAKLTSVPSDILDGVTGLTTIRNMFANCDKIAGALPEFWNDPFLSGITHTQCFLNCDKASNYSDVPTGWK